MAPAVWTKLEVDRLREAFKQADKDKDGKLEKSELEDLLQNQFGSLRDADDLDELLPHIDDGEKIDFEHYVTYTTSDLSMRFDLRFIRHMRESWEDQLGLQLYFPFLALFITYLVIGHSLGPSYWQTFALNDLVMGEEFDTSPDMRFEKFYHEIKDEDEYWMWVHGPLLNAWWGENDGDAANGYAKYANMPVGALKLRQVRVEPETCASRHAFYPNRVRHTNLSAVIGDGGLTVRDRLGHFPLECFPKWRSTRRYTGPYIVDRTIPADAPFSTDVTRVPLNVSRVQADAYQMVGEALWHRDCSNNVQSSIQGLTVTGLNASTFMWFEAKASNYDCEGYALVIPFSWNRSRVVQALGYLQNGIPYTADDGTEKKLPWIDLQTRALSVEMFTYSPNVNLFSRLQYLVEVTDGGAWVPASKTINFKLFQWKTFQFAYFFFMFLFVLILVCHFMSWCTRVWGAASDLKHDWRATGVLVTTKAVIRTLATHWMALDLTNYLFFACAWSIKFWLMAYGMTNTPVLENDWFPDEYETVARWVQIANYFDGVNALLCCIRILYYLRLNPRFNLLPKSLEKAKEELWGLLLIFFILFVGFCLMGYIVLGQVVEDFRNPWLTPVVLLRYMVGDFDYVQIREERRVLGPLFFSMFQTTCFLVLLNMVIAVLSDSFSEVQEEKWRPEMLRSLMDNTNDPIYDPKKGQTSNMFNNLAVVREVRYWVTRFVLSVKDALFNVSDIEARKRDADNLNPRIYWEKKEGAIHAKKSVASFVDKLNLCVLQLEDYLVFGGDTEDDDDGPQSFQGFGYDYEQVAKHLVTAPAEKMDRESRLLLTDLLESHHYWHNEVRGIAEFGDPDEPARHRETERKDDQIKQLFKAQRLSMYAYGDVDDDDMYDAVSHAESHDLGDEEEEFDNVEEWRRRCKEQDTLMDDIVQQASSIHSNKQQIQGLMRGALISALQSRLARPKCAMRFEDNSHVQIRVHRLIGARFGQYLPDGVMARRTHNVTIFTGDDPDATSMPFALVSHASESAMLAEAKKALGIPREKGVRVMRHRRSCPFDDVTEAEVRFTFDGVGGPATGHLLRLDVVEGVEAVDWNSVKWAEVSGKTEIADAKTPAQMEDNGGKTSRMWRELICEKALLAELQKRINTKTGVLETHVGRPYLVPDHYDGPRDDAASKVFTERTMTKDGNIIEEDDDEEVLCYSQLELIYEPVTRFREHMEDTIHDMVRKKLPNLMLSTLETQQLMTLLEWKVRNDKRQNQF